MADYTDGGGWGKLDRTGARELSAVVGSFPRARCETWCRLLLTLYASVGGDGTTRMSRRELAQAAGVAEGVAKRFIERMEADGVIVRAGSARSGGVAWCFSWHMEQLSGSKSPRKRPTSENGVGRNSRENDPGGSKSPRKRPTSGSKSPRKRPTYRTLQSSTEGGADAASAAPAARDGIGGDDGWRAPSLAPPMAG